MYADDYKTNYQRIGNVELHYSTFNKMDEIVLWYPNPHYGKEKDMEKDGYVFDGESWNKDCMHIHKSCFVNKESCYVVAFVDWSNDHDEFDIEMVGLRYWELDDKDKKDFDTIIHNMILKGDE